jgi:hypothetical protein
VLSVGSTGSSTTPPASVCSSVGGAEVVGALVDPDGEGDGEGFGFFVLLAVAVGSAGLDESLGVAVGLGVVDVVVGDGDGFFVGVGAGAGVGVGVGVEWGAGSACGRTVPVEPSQTMATYPPAGIVREPAPSEE